MELSKVSFEVNKDATLSDAEKEFLREAYRKLFIKIYGYDVFDALVNVTQISAGRWFSKRKSVQKYAENHIRAFEVIESVEEFDDLELLTIRDEDNKLIGGGRLRRISDTEASIPDLAIDGVSLEESREIWQKAVSYAESYFTSLGYETMYIEVPLREGALLGRAGQLGFTEDPKDIVVSEEIRTYLLNKSLERIQDDKLGAGRK